MTQFVVRRAGSRTYAATPFALKEHVAALPGARWDKGDHVWTYPATPVSVENVAALLEAHGTVSYHDDVVPLVERAHAGREAARFKTMALDELPPINSGSPHPPWLQQAQAFHFARYQEGVLLDMVMGAGKSRVVVDLVNDWHDEQADDGVHRILVVCPKNVLRVWPREFRKHSLREYRVTDGRPFKRNGEPKVTATLAEKVEHLIGHELPMHPRLVVVTNYEAMWREPMAEFLLKQNWHVAVLDECHRAQAPGGKASRFLDKLRDNCDRRVCGTGTLGDTGLAAYGYMRFADPGVFGTSVSKFRHRYGRKRVKYWATDVDSDGALVKTPVYLTIGDSGEPIFDGIAEERADEFAARLARVTYACGDEVIDLGEPVDTRIPVELSAKARRIYDQLETEFVAEVRNAETDDTGYAVVDNALTKLLRLQQVTSGFVPVEDAPQLELTDVADDAVFVGGELRDSTVRIENIDDAKEAALADWLKDVSHPHVVVFAQFVHDLEVIRRVAEHTGRKYGELSGRRDTVLDDEACMRSDVELAAVQIAAGGVGVDLTRARYAVYYSTGSKLVLYQQSRSRLWRPGQQHEHPVEFVHFVAENTVDEDLLDGLADKQEGLAYIMRRIRDRDEANA